LDGLDILSEFSPMNHKFVFLFAALIMALGLGCRGPRAIHQSAPDANIDGTPTRRPLLPEITVTGISGRRIRSLRLPLEKAAGQNKANSRRLHGQDG
jgi:hypothetical protein